HDRCHATDRPGCCRSLRRTRRFHFAPRRRRRMSVAFPPWLDGAWANFRTAVSEGRLSHAILVAGEAGLSKRVLVARMVARLLCQSPTSDNDACGHCHGCNWLHAGTHPDSFRIAPEEDSEVIKVDQIRELIAQVQL